ncbi:MAG: iron ABC transporter permease, partial [Desulfobulbaceae bacterium]|nr:iron ABC transporter permease [Desulfobulbaceae bacterium]
MQYGTGRFHIATITLTALLMAGVLTSATMGFMDVSTHDVFRVLSAKLLGNGLPEGIDPVVGAVVGDVRMPRILTSLLVGGVLAVCGAVFQAVLLNPLADPYTLGVSSGAAFGASLVVVLRLFDIMDPAGTSIALFAFVGAITTLLAVLGLASGDRRLSSTSLILSGVIVAAILSAAIGF